MPSYLEGCLPSASPNGSCMDSSSTYAADVSQVVSQRRHYRRICSEHPWLVLADGPEGLFVQFAHRASADGSALVTGRPLHVALFRHCDLAQNRCRATAPSYGTSTPTAHPATDNSDARCPPATHHA